MKVYLRANGNSTIGYGHLTRMLAFAQAIHQNYQVVLISESLPSNFEREFDQYISEYIQCNIEQYGTEEANYLISFLQTDDILIIDGYQFQPNYFEILKNKNISIIRISDYVEDISYAEVIINHGGTVDRKDYKSRPDHIFYLGPSYALIRKAFFESHFNFEKGRVMISLGGATSKELLENVIDEVLSISNVNYIDVVTTEECSISHTKITYSSGLSDMQMAQLMAKAEVVISPASSLSYEAATVGTGMIVLMLAENQEGQYKYLISNMLAVGIDEYEILLRGRLSQVLMDYLNSDKRNLNIVNQRKYFDGNTHLRLNKIVDKLVRLKDLKIRPATLDDIDLLFRWVSDPEVRNNAINTDPVKYDDHVKWVTSAIANKNRILYILLNNDHPVAQIRFDIEDELATLSYSIDAEFRGRGYGDVVVRNGIKQLLVDRKSITRIKAVVQKKNIASNKVFESCNFTLTESMILNEIDFNLYFK